MSELVESAIRGLFSKQSACKELPPLPEFDSGGAKVNIANREMLYEVMER